jgi:hypothetical protein
MDLRDALDFWTGLLPIRQRIKGKAEVKRSEVAGLSALPRTNLYVGTGIREKLDRKKPVRFLCSRKGSPKFAARNFSSVQEARCFKFLSCSFGADRSSGMNQIGACDFAARCAILRGDEENQKDYTG